MLAKVLSSAVLGVDAYTIEVEANVATKGMIAFFMVGLPSSAVKESKERVRTAIINSGYRFPFHPITLNLAPADIRKDSASLDLPIAISILAATGQVSDKYLEDYIILGELSLDGTLRPIRGALPIAVSAHKSGYKGILLPSENASEAAIVKDLEVYPAKSLDDIINLLSELDDSKRLTVNVDELFQEASNYPLDFRDVRGQAHVKRSLEVAAAGGHNIIMIGPPGSGKTMLARRLPSILPPLTLEEALETTKIHSIMGLLNTNTPLIATRPFRSPHHTVSDAGLIGGGSTPRPGEVSIAHNGILFLDELTEFKKHVLEVLRQPLEDGMVTISRAAISLTYPARFMLAAAMNPCPCGYYTDPNHNCRCTSSMIQRYMSRISGPLLDRIDIHIEVPAVNFEELSGYPTGECSEIIRERINKARQIQLERFEKMKKIYCNAHMLSSQIRKFCKINEASKKLLKMGMTRLGLSARAYDRILKVSRTIADLANSEYISEVHIAEAIQYRTLDRQLWI